MPEGVNVEETIRAAELIERAAESFRAVKDYVGDGLVRHGATEEALYRFQFRDGSEDNYRLPIYLYWASKQLLWNISGLDQAAPDEAAYDLARELHRDRAVADATFERAVAHFGEQGVAELVNLCGFYTMVSMTLKAESVEAT